MIYSSRTSKPLSAPQSPCRVPAFYRLLAGSGVTCLPSLGLRLRPGNRLLLFSWLIPSSLNTAIYISAMPNSNYGDNLLSVVNIVNRPVISFTNAPELGSSNLFHSPWSRLLLQTLKCCYHHPAVLLRKLIKRLSHPPAQFNLIHVEILSEIPGSPLGKSCLPPLPELPDPL